MNNVSVRIATAAVGIPVVVGLLYVGGAPFLLMAAAVALVAQSELYGLAKRHSVQPFQFIGLFLGLLVLLRSVWGWAVPASAIVVVLCVVLVPFLTRGGRPVEELAVTLLGVVYPTMLLSFLVDLRQGRGIGLADAEAFQATLLVLVIVWSADTLAYFAGRRFGRRAMAPKISPGKTWEGALAGAAGAVLVSMAMRQLWLDWLSIEGAVILGLIGGVFGPLGDLAESSFKRSVEAKDSGAILPGHGGVLDRIDALIVVAPLSYLYLFLTAA